MNVISVNPSKIFLFNGLIGLVYGLSPLLSNSIFHEPTPFLSSYNLNFIFCYALYIIFSMNLCNGITFTFNLSLSKAFFVFIISCSFYIWSKVSVYGSFEAAFIASYNERTGIDIKGIERVLFAPLGVFFTASLFVYSVSIASTKSKFRSIHAAILSMGLVIALSTGSRNLLLFSLCGVLAIFISRLRCIYVVLVPIMVYCVSVLLVMLRNHGIVLLLNGEASISYFEFDYFNPAIHEYFTTYNVYRVAIENGADSSLSAAPYGLYSSFVYNVLPYALKPSDFISFSEYYSLLYAPPGEGIGSSPVLELFLSNYLSLPLLFFVLFIIFTFQRNLKKNFLKFTLISLSIAFSFNFWRIGTAENFKMFLSYLIAILIVYKITLANINHAGGNILRIWCRRHRRFTSTFTQQT
jgi:hypothetical protein